MQPPLSPEALIVGGQEALGKEALIIGGKKHNKTYRKKRHGNKSLTAWVKFVKKVAREEKLPYRDAMMRAKVRKDKGEKWMSGGNDPELGQESVSESVSESKPVVEPVVEPVPEFESELKPSMGGRRRRTRRGSKKRRGTKRRGSKKRR